MVESRLAVGKDSLSDLHDRRRHRCLASAWKMLILLIGQSSHMEALDVTEEKEQR